MKKALLLIFLTVGMLSAEEEALIFRQGWGNGEKFLAMSKAQQALLTAGIISGLFVSPLMGAPDHGPEIAALAGCTDNMSLAQAAAIVEKYLRDHPEHWNIGIAISTVFALRGACPDLDAAMSK